jgi:hypothetical protein
MNKQMNYGGYECNGIAIGVTKLPNRARPCLYVRKGNVLYPLAYFTSEDKAEMFMHEFWTFIKNVGLSEANEWTI